MKKTIQHQNQNIFFFTVGIMILLSVILIFFDHIEIILQSIREEIIFRIIPVFVVSYNFANLRKPHNKYFQIAILQSIIFLLFFNLVFALAHVDYGVLAKSYLFLKYFLISCAMLILILFKHYSLAIFLPIFIHLFTNLSLVI